jgi:osmotically-inducible protein OsmY
VPHQKRDPEIHRQVRAELGIQPEDGGRSIEITVHRGVVYLTGFVESHSEKQAIDRAMRRIAGVKGLCDYLQVRPP